MADSDDEPITLSSHALAALQEFYGERDARADKFEKLKAATEDQHDAAAAAAQPLSMDAFTEDWNASQFWYSDETATLLAKQLLDGVREDEVIAVVSTPSVFVALKNLLNAADANTPKPKKVLLLEHDQRFSVFPEFVFYDFQQPFKLPAELKGAVDRIIYDPPFLSEDCQTKIALTVRWMSRPGPRLRLVVCTGERMEPLITKLYRALGARATTYELVHARGLSNEFYCYANFECDAWKYRGGERG
ncbi:N(6)-adenine-specific DNA methyltransferase [Daldinia caldariorum]|uniref:N(6)-adenine-specific DNA methyltransferase n=1 Tax=Daldinia caldariorum TaxID=326644 RepID=UPI0020077DD7|nr:N(6)-adenine-specific DNA methyltransferase [Daldinia caldariorum]KAI1469427.1 N(6)-adenine-specific DNA methyltransferase [Daldinia caldariorum]